MTATPQTQSTADEILDKLVKGETTVDELEAQGVDISQLNAEYDKLEAAEKQEAEDQRRKREAAQPQVHHANILDKYTTPGSVPSVEEVLAEERAVAEAKRNRVPRKCLADFKRDADFSNVLIKGRWAVRGTISMHISTTGSGKSILQTQSALCFNRGLPCCGLEPTRPFRSWIIQSEDDDDRIAIDRDDILAYLSEQHPTADWNAAMHDTTFLDFTGLTGADFISRLDAELTLVAERPGERPDAILLNPWNKYIGGDPLSHKDVSAFLAGGEIGRKDTQGIESVIKRHGVWLWIFAHTAKPPTSKELSAWLADPYSCYKCCGSSALPDAVRSIITFLKDPKRDGLFAFTAGKNGSGLGWTDADGNKTTIRAFRWGEDGRHYWRDAGDADAADVFDAGDADKLAAAGARHVAANNEMRKILLAAIKQGGVKNPLSICEAEELLKGKGYGEGKVKGLIKLLTSTLRDGEEVHVVERQPEITRNAKGSLVKRKQGATFLFTPELKAAYLRQWGVTA